MTQRFVKGYTNNHLSWVMVDATDFATPESALSAATTIKIYGKVKGATGVNFVSSGTGSLTNDIQHVGPSVLGAYTIALAKADLSDASNAWYDQYIIALSGTGAARQLLIVDGGIMESYLSGVGSDILSAAVALSGLVSDAHSAAILAASNASEAQSHATLAASRILLVQSRLSDFMSAIYPSDISDIRSMLTALSDAISNVHSELTSQFAVVSNYLSNASNFQSDILSTMGSQYSDLASKIGAVSVTLTDSDISDIASAVIAGGVPTASEIAAKVWSDYGSKVGATPSQAYSVLLLAGSRISDILVDTAGLNGADASDIASAVWAHAKGGSVLSYGAIGSSEASNAASGVTVLLSRITSVAATSSDLISKIEAGLLSDIYSAISDHRSTTDSQFAVISNYLSNASNFQSDILSTMASQFAVESNYLSYISNIVSGLGAGESASAIAAKVWSDYGSKVGATPSQAYSVALTGASFASDAASAAQQANSRILLVQSRLSDFMSAIYPSDISDIRSMLTALSDAISNVDSAVNSQYSDLDSKLTSQFTYLSATLSDIDSAANSQYSDLDSKLTSVHSDLKSGIGAVSVALSASDISDLASQVVQAISSAIIDVNVVQVNEIAISGTGVQGDTWGPG